MTKLQLLHRALNERLMAAVEQIMEMVGGTVLEYEEETIRARKENEALKRRLRWIEGASSAGWQGSSEPVTVSIPDELNPSQQDESAINFEFGPETESVVIKTESTDFPLSVRSESSLVTLPQNTDQGSDSAGTSAGVTAGLSDSVNWDSAQSYMAPLDFDPTSGPKSVSQWSGQSRRQRMSFACPDCGKVFSAKQRLLIHMRIHSTERPYTYRRRKECFYGENKKNRKLQRLSQLSREVVDLSDSSEQINRSSASPDGTAVNAEEEEPEGVSSGSDHTSSAKEQKSTANMPREHGKQRHSTPQLICYCPYCPGREFSRPSQLAMHMKIHKEERTVNAHGQAQSTTSAVVEAERKLPKKQGKNDAVKKPKETAKGDFPCPECNRVFAFKTRLLFHMNTHTSKKALLQKQLEMAVQSKPSKEETVAIPKTTEVQKVKEGKKTVSCPHCTKVFTREAWLEPHIRMHHREKNSKGDPSNVLFARGPRQSKRLLKQLRKLRAEAKAVTESSKTETEISKKLKTKQAIPDQLRWETEETERVPTENKGVTEETEESQVNAKPSQSCEESNMDVDGPKITADEAEESSGLPKLGTDASEEANEEAPGTDAGPSNAKRRRKIFSCKICGNVFVQKRTFKKHSSKHVCQRLIEEKRKKRLRAQEEEEELMKQEEKRRKKDEERLDAKTSTSLIKNHNPNTTQTHQESPNTELLQKSRARGQGPLPCPFCGKVFAWEMRLMMHMQIHCGEKPYPYRQRKKHFYGDLKRGQLQNNQEPHGNNSDESEQSAGEEPVIEDCSSFLLQTSTEQTTTINEKNQRTNPQLISDIMRHFRLQPRIVLKPVTTEYKHWSSVSEVLQSANSETSGIDNEQPSSSVLNDKQSEDASENQIVNSNLCTSPVKDSSPGVQDKQEEYLISEEEIVSVVVCSPQCDSQSEVLLDKACDSLGIESADGRQEKDNDCSFISETIIINDQPEEPGETKFQSAPSECVRMNCDCSNTHLMKLTIMPHTSVVETLFKETSTSAMQRSNTSVCVVLSDSEDGADEDVLSSNRPTASVIGVENKTLDVETKPSEKSSNDSNLPAPDTAESINTDGDDTLSVHAKSIEAPSIDTENAEVVPTEIMDSNTSDDQLTGNQNTPAAVRQVEDSPMNLEETLCQTSDMVFAGQAIPSEVDAVVTGSDNSAAEMQ